MQRAGIRNHLTRSIHRLAHRPCAIGGTMSNPERFPGSREEDAWLSDEQLERCAPAETETFQGPVPTRMISNGEYMPHPQTYVTGMDLISVAPHALELRNAIPQFDCIESSSNSQG